MTRSRKIEHEVNLERAKALALFLAVGAALVGLVLLVGEGLWAAPTGGRRGLFVLLALTLMPLAWCGARAARGVWAKACWLETLAREWALQERRHDLGVEPDLDDASLEAVQREKRELARRRGWHAPREELAAIEAKWRTRARRTTVALARWS